MFRPTSSSFSRFAPRASSRVLAVRQAFRLSTLTGGLLLAFAAAAGAADGARQSYNLPAEPLTRAVNAVARQAGVQLIFSGGITDGLSAPALSGEYSAREALEKLLKGSGLRLRQRDERSFVIEPVPATGAAGSGEQTLRPVLVSAAGVVPFRPATVRSATKTETRQLDVAQSVAVIDQELIREQRAIRMEDALRNVAGVYAGQSEGRRDTFTIRGFSAELDTYVDGVRDNAGYRDFSNIERVEVLKGPAAMLFGRGSAGGIINRVSKKPTADDMREAQLTVGSFDFLRAEWDLGGALAAGANARFTGAHEKGGVFRDKIGHELSTAALGVDFRLAERTSLLAQVEWQHHERTPDRGLPSVGRQPADVKTSNFYGSPYDYATRDTVGVGAVFDHAFSDTTQFKATVRWSQMELDAMNTRNIGLNAGMNEVRRQSLRFPKQKEFAFAQFDLTHKLVTGGLQHEILAGYEHGSQRGRLEVWRRSAGNVNLYDPVDNAPEPVFTLANKSYDTRFVGTTDAFYLQDQITFSPEWKAVAGIRHDTFRQRQEAGLVNFAQSPALERTDRAWSPRLGLIWQPAAAHSIYVSTAHAFQPKAEDLLFASAADTRMKPTETVQYEVGNKNEFFGGRLGVNLALYDITMRNVVTSDPSNPGQLIQVGEQRHRGAEIDISGELGDGWRVYGGATRIDAEVTRSNDPALPEGNRPLNVPRISANLWLSKSFLDYWRAGFGAYYVGERYAFSDNVVTMPGYTRLDGALSYRWKSAEFSLNLRNLANVRYYDSATNNNQILPGIPRSAMLTARFAF